MTDTLPIDSIIIDRWTDQWIKQLGFTSEQLIKRNTKIEQFANSVLDRIKQKKTNDISKREQLLIEALREYEHRLSRTGFENDFDEEFENLQLKQKEILIEKKHQDLDSQEEKFIRELDQLSKTERILCHVLTETSMEILPNETLIKRIERLKTYLNNLEIIKNDRLTKVKTYRTRIETLCTQLNFQSNKSSVISQLLNEKYESCLKTDSLNQIEIFLTELECKLDEQNKHITKLVEKLEKLYIKFESDDGPSTKRSAAYILRENTAETVKQLENEITDLEAKRMATSQIYCESMRKKLQELYEQCQLGVSQRYPIDFENITPETLDQCDQEYDRLDKMYSEKKSTLEAYDQWKLLAQQWTDFKIKSSSAARFHERGYSAIKEQAERKRFLLALPKAKQTCLNALEQWENEHANEQFLINDVPIHYLIKQINDTTALNTTTVQNPPTTLTKTTSMSSIGSTVASQRTLAKTNTRKKSLRNLVKQSVEQHEDTLEFTQLENIKHINGLPRIVTSTPKTGKANVSSHTIVDTGRNKANDPIQKRRPSKHIIPIRR